MSLETAAVLASLSTDPIAAMQPLLTDEERAAQIARLKARDDIDTPYQPVSDTEIAAVFGAGTA